MNEKPRDIRDSHHDASGDMGVSSEREGLTGPGQEGTDGVRDVTPPERDPDAEPGDESQGENVEDDVSARDAARWVPLRQTEAGNGRPPRPRAQRRAVELEPYDNHEDASVDGTARPDEYPDQERAPIVPATSGAGSTVTPATPHVRATAPAATRSAVARAARSARERPAS